MIKIILTKTVSPGLLPAVGDGWYNDASSLSFIILKGIDPELLSIVTAHELGHVRCKHHINHPFNVWTREVAAWKEAARGWAGDKETFMGYARQCLTTYLEFAHA